MMDIHTPNGQDISLAKIYTGELIQGDILPHARIVNIDQEQEYIAMQHKDVERCKIYIQACIICVMVICVAGIIIFLFTV
jgi:hypothetical protein